MALPLNILFLLTALQVFSPSEDQIRQYYTNIDQGVDIAASAWSLIHYARENDEFRQDVIEIGTTLGHSWQLNLANQEIDIYEAIHEVSLHFNEPRLQIALQLELQDSLKANNYFTEFRNRYSENDNSAQLLERIAYNEPISSDLFTNQPWDFYHFLIFFNFREVQFIDESEVWTFVRNMINNLNSFGNSTSELNKAFFHATLIRALYTNGSDQLIDENYETLTEMRALPNTTLKRDLYWTIDFISYELGSINRSLEVQNTYTIPLTERLGDNYSLNAILANNGAYYLRLGKFEEAKRVLSTALQDTSYLDPGTHTLLLNNLSLAHFKLGDTDKYLEIQFRALDFARDQENFSHQLNIYRNLHVYHRKNRDWESATEYIIEARTIAENWGNETELASVILSQVAFADIYLNDPVQTAFYLNEAEELLSDEDNYSLMVRMLFGRAKLFKETSRLTESIEVYNRIMEISIENSDNVNYLDALIRLSDTFLRLGELEKVKRNIQELNAYDLSVIDFPFLVQARTVEAKLVILEERYRDANDILSYVSQQVLERSMNTTDPEAGYWHVEDTYLEMFQTYANFLNQQGKSDKIIALLDHLKMINDASLYDNPLVRSASLSQEQLAQYQLITDELDQLRKQLLVTSENDERFQLQNEISALSAQLRQFSMRQNQMANPDNFRIWPIQARLKSNQAVLHLTRILDTLYLITIRENEITVQTKPLAEAEEQLFEEAIIGISSGNTDLNRLHEIYNYLELDDLPSKITSLIVVPDSYLYQLPLDVLPTEQPAQAFSYGSAHYLIEDMEISYLNNLNEFLKESPKPFYALDFAGFGISEFSNMNSDRNLVPLPGAPLEVAEIENQLTRFNATETYIESEATPQHFLSQASRSRILHLATHSTISENDPLFSRLYLYPDARDLNTPDELSGQVFAYQLFNQNLNNELIMLNSCDSGSGRYFQGSGIMGISRALRYAGAHSLVLNSWAVNDQFASDFAIEFYSHINDGDSKSQALREAKLHFLRTKNANPHYWGPYMLNGDRDPMVQKRGTMQTTAFLLFFTLIGAWVSFKRNQVFESGS